MIELRQRRGPGPRWLRVGWLLLAGVALLANTAHAFTSSSIEWEAPEACPSASALSERLSVLLGEDAGLLGGGTQVRGVVSKDASGYRVVLEVGEAEHAQLERRNPGPLLEQERLVTRVLALCALGAVSQAQDLRRQLERLEPESIYRGQLAASCAKKQ
ncbi:MAG: hypothetical protein ABI895_21110 [Deltaproteobacteria bacterium]